MSDKGYHATLKIPFLTFWPSERSGVMYAMHKRPDPHGYGSKMRGMKPIRFQRGGTAQAATR